MLEKVKNVKFCIDSSAFIILHRYYSPKYFKPLWENIETLFKEGKIISHKIVYDELTTSSNDPDELCKWIKGKRKYFESDTGKQAIYVSEIISRYPQLIDPEKEKDEADPWLIALVMQKKEESNIFENATKWIVVSQENEKKPFKIPAVCRQYSIDHFSLNDFFDFMGWKFSINEIA